MSESVSESTSESAPDSSGAPGASPTSEATASSSGAGGADGSTDGPDSPVSDPEPATAPAPTGPQVCADTVSTIGATVWLEIVVGDVDCAFAMELLETYYTDPPEPPAGSGAFVTIGDWECNSSSSQEPGRASTCRTVDGGEIVALVDAPAGHGDQGTGDDDPSTPGTDDPCSLVDQPTLDRLFGDGPYDEAVCLTYIGAENSLPTDP
ncbi:MAG: hypothetical protein ACTHW7_11055 [Actinomycetaceae bacterium]